MKVKETHGISFSMYIYKYVQIYHKEHILHARSYRGPRPCPIRPCVEYALFTVKYGHIVDHVLSA